MEYVLFKIKKILDKDFINNYDLLVIPSFPFNKRIKLNDIKIIPGNKNRIDQITIKHPYNKDNTSKELLLNTYIKLLDIIKINEYKNILIDYRYIPIINECSSFNNKEICHKIYNLINEYIKDKEINITIVISNKKDKKYYFD
ncbi:MAG: hypothetical protein IKQ29_02810 [Bacilli bacterium]|nr:hypothetical protein [Bacilli bacterium]